MWIMYHTFYTLIDHSIDSGLGIVQFCRCENLANTTWCLLGNLKKQTGCDAASFRFFWSDPITLQSNYLKQGSFGHRKVKKAVNSPTQKRIKKSPIDLLGHYVNTRVRGYINTKMFRRLHRKSTVCHARSSHRWQRSPFTNQIFSIPDFRWLDFCAPWPLFF